MKVGESRRTWAIQFGSPPKKQHLFWRTLMHVTLVFLTGGLWLLWLIVRKLVA